MINAIEAELFFYSIKKDGILIEREYATGLIVDFKIRNDMFNCGKIEFIDRASVFSGETHINACISFLYWNYIVDYLFVGKEFTFGQPSFPYGKGKVIKINKYEK